MLEEQIIQAKNTNGGVPEDLPPKLAKSGQRPKIWKIEQGLALKKVPEPKNEHKLRLISITPFLSKIFEKLVIEWLFLYISEKVDINQYGGRKGISVNHYLIDFISVIFYNQDQNDTMAMLAAMILQQGL